MPADDDNTVRFQSTLPARGATALRQQPRDRLRISIHAPRTGSDTPYVCGPRELEGFQSTLPARGATHSTQFKLFGMGISIHAPRTGSDEHGHKTADGQPISIHAPRTGSDVMTLLVMFMPGKFQSTLPARGATGCRRKRFSSAYFNPRSPHGERRDINASAIVHERISIHAPRTGSDWRCWLRKPTPEISIHAPRTGSDARKVIQSLLEEISIHAPRTGSDLLCACDKSQNINFNPRSPHGERPRCFARPPRNPSDFNPRSPHGERHLLLPPCPHPRHFNPRSPHGERLNIDFLVYMVVVFQSTLPARGATYLSAPVHCTSPFQSTLPARGATVSQR